MFQIVQPPRPGAQCGHHLFAGLSKGKSALPAPSFLTMDSSLQHIEHSPHGLNSRSCNSAVSVIIG